MIEAEDARWESLGTDNGAHVRPLNDVVEHPASEDCVCGPRVEPVPRDDGSMAWLVVHHSLDGRELTEQG